MCPPVPYKVTLLHPAPSPVWGWLRIILVLVFVDFISVESVHE